MCHTVSQPPVNARGITVLKLVLCAGTRCVWWSGRFSTLRRSLVLSRWWRPPAASWCPTGPCTWRHLWTKRCANSPDTQKPVLCFYANNGVLCVAVLSRRAHQRQRPRHQQLHQDRQEGEDLRYASLDSFSALLCTPSCYHSHTSSVCLPQCVSTQTSACSALPSINVQWLSWRQSKCPCPCMLVKLV